MERFSERKVCTIHANVPRLDRFFFLKLHHPPCCLGNFADYGRQVHEGDRDTRSQSQNEEGPSFLSLQGTSV